jgi:hypothetical protein
LRREHPYFGSLQGTASTGSSEARRHTGGAPDARRPDDAVGHLQITSGADKSSKAYGVAFEQAQELFGVFDGITRMNLKAMQAKAELGKESGEAQRRSSKDCRAGNRCRYERSER